MPASPKRALGGIGRGPWVCQACYLRFYRNGTYKRRGRRRVSGARQRRARALVARGCSQREAARALRMCRKTLARILG
jgi:hypothetical protein